MLKKLSVCHLRLNALFVHHFSGDCIWCNNYAYLFQALGHSVACWLCPTATGHLGSGLQFRTFSDDLAHTQQSLSHGWIASPLKVAITTCNQWLKSRFRGWVWQLKKMIWMVWRSEVLGFFQHRGSFHNEVTR